MCDATGLPCVGCTQYLHLHLCGLLRASARVLEAPGVRMSIYLYVRMCLSLLQAMDQGMVALSVSVRVLQMLINLVKVCARVCVCACVRVCVCVCDWCA